MLNHKRQTDSQTEENKKRKTENDTPETHISVTKQLQNDMLVQSLNGVKDFIEKIGENASNNVSTLNSTSTGTPTSTLSSSRNISDITTIVTGHANSYYRGIIERGIVRGVKNMKDEEVEKVIQNAVHEAVNDIRFKDLETDHFTEENRELLSCVSDIYKNITTRNNMEFSLISELNEHMRNIPIQECRTAVLPVLSSSYFSKYLEEPNEGEFFCGSSNCNRIEEARDMNNHNNRCWAFKDHGLTLKEFLTPDDVESKEQKDKPFDCIYCNRRNTNMLYFTMKQSVERGVPVKVAIQDHGVKTDTPGEYNSSLCMQEEDTFYGITSPFPMHKRSMYVLESTPQKRSLVETSDFFFFPQTSTPLR